MEGRRLFQAFLLAQMRSELVAPALEDLDVSRTDAQEARRMVEEKGLGKPGHAQALYAKLFGAPDREVARSGGDGQSEQAMLYDFGLWPRHSLCVLGREGYTYGLQFVSRVSGAAATAELGSLVPWQHTELELAALLRDGSVSEEWYPVKDYIIDAHRSDSHFRHILQFDFQLLQRVVVEPA